MYYKSPLTYDFFWELFLLPNKQIFRHDLWVRTGSGVYPEFPSHMHNTAGGSLHRRVHNSKRSALFRREGKQPAQAGSDILPPLGRSHRMMFTAPRHRWLQLLHKLSWQECASVFLREIFVSFCFIHLSKLIRPGNVFPILLLSNFGEPVWIVASVSCS